MSKIMEPMKMVKQTGTTIVFEEFNKQKIDLYTLLTRDETPVSLEKFKNYLVGAESEIAVRSFGEFMNVFLCMTPHLTNSAFSSPGMSENTLFCSPNLNLSYPEKRREEMLERSIVCFSPSG